MAQAGRKPGRVIGDQRFEHILARFGVFGVEAVIDADEMELFSNGAKAPGYTATPQCNGIVGGAAIDETLRQFQPDQHDQRHIDVFQKAARFESTTAVPRANHAPHAGPAPLSPSAVKDTDHDRQTVLVNSRAERWTGSGFTSSFQKERKRLQLGQVTFQDLRGTGITYAYAKGASIEDITGISGHSKDTCDGINRSHYLAGESVIEGIISGTKL